MARSSAQKNYFNFVAGLNTEASPLTSPENTSRAGDNFDLRRDGSLRRRRGIDREKGAPPEAWVWTGTTAHTASTHEWRSVGGVGSLNKLLVQYDKYLHIANLDGAITQDPSFTPVFDASLVGGPVSGTYFDMSILAVDGVDISSDKIQVSFGKGAAFVVGPNISPFLIQYEQVTGSYTIDYIGRSASNILTRDLSGVEDGLALDNRPTYATYSALALGATLQLYNPPNPGL